MNPMTIHTIVTDMDDTLLNADAELSGETLRVMRECQKRDIGLIPASGRAQASMEPYMRQLNTGLPYIACNGAQLVSANHEVMEELLLSAELAREVCAFFQDHGSYVQAYRDDCFYYAAECQPSRAYKKSSGMKGVAVGDLLAFLDFDTPKLLAVAEPELVAEMYEKSEKVFGGRVAFTISKPYFLEAAPPQANKGAALKRLAEYMNISPEQTLVFGDSLNDLSMLAYGPNSVAMGNARQEVKQAAAYICLPNTQDGVARFIQENVLEAKA